MIWKGTYSATVSYKVNDVALYGNQLWICLVANVASTPTSSNTNWSKIGNTIHSCGGSFDGGGSALTAGKTVYTTVPFACTVSAWNIVADTGTATVDVWRLATGTAIPTAANVITGTGAGRPALASGTAIHSTNLTGWSSTAIAANNIIGVNLQAVATATYVNLVVECVQ